MDFTEYDTRIAGYAIMVDADDRILLTWFNGHGDPAHAAWSLPGGGIEFDEAVEDGVVREVYEESGYHVELTGFLGTSTWINTEHPRPRKGVRLFYTARIVGGTLGTTEVGGSTDVAQWFPRADVGAMASVSDVVAIAVELLAGQNPPRA